MSLPELGQGVPTSTVSATFAASKNQHERSYTLLLGEGMPLVKVQASTTGAEYAEAGSLTRLPVEASASWSVIGIATIRVGIGMAHALLLTTTAPHAPLPPPHTPDEPLASMSAQSELSPTIDMSLQLHRRYAPALAKLKHPS